MATELHVFFHGDLPSKAALGRAIKELGFPLTLTSRTGSLERHRGFLPMRLNREESGIEFDLFDGRETIEEIAAGVAVDSGLDRSASFRWGGDEGEMLCALCAAAALAGLTNGIVLGDDEERPLSSDEAVVVARQHLAAIATPKDKRPGTRPADIKRYLRPLLQQRSDLVLMGRLLVIWPVRHLVRGAIFDRTSDKYEFRIWWVLKALYDPRGSFGYGEYVRVATCPVWEPHFEPLLFDALAEDVFAHVGPVTTLVGVADLLKDDARNSRYDAEQVKALLLAGERDRAAAHVREVERREVGDGYWSSWADEMRTLLARDIDEVCAEAHAKEAEIVRKMKIEALWEPSPFPAELPAPERAARCDEPVFSPTPWISTPPWLLQEPPDVPGDVRFAKDFIWRDDRWLLLVPLSREAAELRHREGEPYVLCAREPDGVLVQLTMWGEDRNNPRYPTRMEGRFLWLGLRLRGTQHLVMVDFCTSSRSDEMIEWKLVSVDRLAPRDRIWQCVVEPDGDAEIRGWRASDGDEQACRPVSTADRELLTSPIPEFGDFSGLVSRVRTWLRNYGFGEIV